MQRPGGDPATRQMAIDGIDAERQYAVPRAHALDRGDPLAQIFNDGVNGHVGAQTRIEVKCSSFVPLGIGRRQGRASERDRIERGILGPGQGIEGSGNIFEPRCKAPPGA